MDLIEARYLIETPMAPEKIAGIMAGEQSSGTFVRVAGETDELRERCAARILGIRELTPVNQPSLTSAYLEARGVKGPYRRAEIRIGFPTGNIGRNLATLASTVSGNLYDLGEITGLKLIDVTVPKSYRDLYDYPVAGTKGTRDRMSVHGRPFFGTIIKPNVGLRSHEIADLVDQLCEAGVDFIKDDEICANPESAPLAERIPAVMDRVRRYRDKTGRDVMIAFNITDETDAMRRHADLIAKEGGSCAMVSMNWAGLSALQTLRKSTNLVLHGHRNGFGALSRHPLIGMSFPAYQTLYRLTGMDHMHVHGMGGKFCDDDSEVAASAELCAKPLAEGNGDEDRVLPVFSSGQWAGTVPATYEAVGSADFMFLAGGGILAHPSGPAAGITSLRQAWEACEAGISLEKHAKDNKALAEALSFYGARG
ncbi:ribulose 1,5-bisphosphate carboxylase [Thalassospira sp. HJ]|uniref:ribulose-bisphosphate carboxylase large subunit family protein n=1 Tax=Thalassospira sp. HJ TaxID=1616823 RepID=UPI0005CEB7DF|nr:ribulose-bisphosphate carboxylase large subunit family protein [Thalassospira sp. HJ]KJE34390.1 ribulose 1,5-bisphosphate carboxylase [Thalassospira sp. HJ]